MLAGIIDEREEALRKKQVKALSPYVDLYEIRWDKLYPFVVEKTNWIDTLDKPLLFTLRKKSQGGEFPLSEKKRVELLYQLAQLSPTYFDIEWETDSSVIKDLLRRYPNIRWIISHHIFDTSRVSVESLFSTMQQSIYCWYKIAVRVEDPLSLTQMMLFSKKHPNLSLILMGDQYSEMRMLGPFCRNPIDYATAFPAKNNLGQLTAKKMQKIYRYGKIDQKSKIYALIGDPVDRSVGALFHNWLFNKQGENALYLRIKVKKEELLGFLSLASFFPFWGFSVTTPLKEELFSSLDLLDEEAKEMGAVNTLLLTKDGYKGYNSDGKGAIDAVGDLFGKRVLILGAGGAARAIAFTAAKKNAKVYIYNRTEEKGKKIAKEFKVHWTSSKVDYDLLINTIPLYMSGWVEDNSVVMDVVQRPKWTSWLKEARKRGAIAVFGREMFIRQALLQNYLWQTKEKWSEDPHLYENILRGLKRASF